MDNHLIHTCVHFQLWTNYEAMNFKSPSNVEVNLFEIQKHLFGESKNVIIYYRCWIKNNKKEGNVSSAVLIVDCLMKNALVAASKVKC